MTSLMNDVVNHEMFNGTPKIVVLSNGVLKLGGKVKGKHVAHFL